MSLLLLLLPVVSGNNDTSFGVSRNEDVERKGDDDGSVGKKKVSGVSVRIDPPPSAPSTQHPMLGSPGQEFLEHHPKERGET